MLKSEFQYFYPEWNVKKSGFSPQKKIGEDPSQNEVT